MMSVNVLWNTIPTEIDFLARKTTLGPVKCLNEEFRQAGFFQRIRKRENQINCSKIYNFKCKKSMEKQAYQ